MSSRKRGGAANEIYQEHLFGRFNINSNTQRKALIRRMYQRVFSELAMNRFHWDGFDEDVDVRFLETKLLFDALAVFYKDKDYDNKGFALGATSLGQLDIKMNPTSFLITGGMFIGTDGKIFPSKELKADECVPIWANYMRIPDMDIVNLFADKLSELEITEEINSQNARMNKFLVSSDKQRLTTQNIQRQMAEGVNGIQVDGSIGDLAFMTVADLSVNPDSYEKIEILLKSVWNRAMGLLGIDNANQDKKERLVSAEVGANDEQTSLMKYVNLNARQQAAEAINKKYGMSVTVEYNTDIAERAAMVYEATLQEQTNNSQSDNDNETEDKEDK